MKRTIGAARLPCGRGMVMRVAVGAVAVVAIVASTLRLVDTFAAAPERLAGSARDRTEAKKAGVYAAETEETKALFTRMGKPGPHDWLAHFPEPGQTVDEYRLAWFNRKTAKRHVFCILPLEPLLAVQKQCLPKMRDYARAFFDCTAKVLSAQALPKEAYQPGRRQYHAGKVLDWLGPQVPADAVVTVGITGADLYHRRLNFVFGVGSMMGRNGIYSLHRYGTDQPALLRRALKVMNHEVGHIFSLRHCIFYECSMNGSNGLFESDPRPIHYCPVCHEKLRLAVGFDPVKRFEKLAAFYTSIGFDDDAAFCRRRLAFHQPKKRTSGG